MIDRGFSREGRSREQGNLTQNLQIWIGDQTHGLILNVSLKGLTPTAAAAQEEKAVQLTCMDFPARQVSSTSASSPHGSAGQSSSLLLLLVLRHRRPQAHRKRWHKYRCHVPTSSKPNRQTMREQFLRPQKRGTELRHRNEFISTMYTSAGETLTCGVLY